MSNIKIRISSALRGLAALSIASVAASARADAPKPVATSESFLIEKLNDPNLLSQAQAVPYKDAAGKVTGFKIMSLVPGSFYEQMGLQAGDVISQVNGQPMSSLAAAQELYARAPSSDGVRVTLLRDGKRIERIFKISTGKGAAQ